jgi:hypothetical protein
MRILFQVIETYAGLKKLARELLYPSRMQTTFTTSLIEKIQTQLDATTDALRGVVIALELEKAKAIPADAEEGFMVLMGLGGMLNTLADLRARVEQTSAVLPSPNALGAEFSSKAAELGKSLFATLGYISAIEGEITKLAYERMDQIAA